MIQTFATLCAGSPGCSSICHHLHMVGSTFWLAPHEYSMKRCILVGASTGRTNSHWQPGCMSHVRSRRRRQLLSDLDRSLNLKGHPIRSTFRQPSMYPLVVTVPKYVFIFMKFTFSDGWRGFARHSRALRSMIETGQCQRSLPLRS